MDIVDYVAVARPFGSFPALLPGLAWSLRRRQRPAPSIRASHQIRVRRDCRSSSLTEVSPKSMTVTVTTTCASESRSAVPG